MTQKLLGIGKITEKQLVLYEQGVSDIEKFCSEIYESYPEDNKPEIIVSDEIYHDEVKILITPRKKISVMFEGRDRQILSVLVSPDDADEIKSDLNSGNFVEVLVNGRSHTFTKFQFRGTEEIKPKEMWYKLYPAEELERMDREGRKRFAECMGGYMQKTFPNDNDE